MQNQKRWGIVVFATVMFFLTFLLNPVLSGGRSSANGLYLFVWIMVGWHAHKGDLKSIISLMKIFILLAILVIFLVYLFIGDNSSIGMSVKHSIAIGVAIMLMPKVGLYYYCKNLIDAHPLSPINENTVMIKNTYFDSAPKTNKSFFNTPNLPLADDSLPSTANDEVYFEQAMNEFEVNRRKGLWIKLLAQNEGEENKSKFLYIKIRAQEIHDLEVLEFAKQQELAKLERDENMRLENETKRATIASTGFFKNRSFLYTEYMDGSVVVRHESTGSISKFASLAHAKIDFRE